MDMVEIPARDKKTGFEESWVPKAVRKAYDQWIQEEFWAREKANTAVAPDFLVLILWNHPKETLNSGFSQVYDTQQP